jgi:hypothetical protein
MFCAHGLVLGGTEGVSSNFHVLRSQSRIRRYRGCRLPFSAFARPESFSVVPRASSPVFIFCAPGLVFDGTEGVGTRFHVLHSRTCFRRYRVRRVQFLIFAIPDSFSAVPRASGPVFIFCAPGLVSAVPRATSPVFMFCAPGFGVPRASGPVFMFCAPTLVFGGTEGAGSLFFTLPKSFPAVPRASVPVFMFCAPRLFFCGTEGVGSRFHVLRARTHFRQYRGRPIPDPVFMFSDPGFFFGGPESVGSRFRGLHAWTCFRRNRGRRLPFSSFGVPDSFLVVPRESGHVFMF